MQGPLTQWVTDHRKHHALSDRPGDPHSPHAGHGDSLAEHVLGLWHSHIGWLFSTKGLERGVEYGRDLYEDRLVRGIDRLYLLWVALTLGLPFLAGYLVGGSWQRGLEAMVWAGLVRIFLFQHVTFSINSICHFFGEQPFRTRDESRNVWLLAIPSFGESWHNGHHAFRPRQSTASRPASSTSRACDPRHGQAPSRVRGQAPRSTSDRAATARGCPGSQRRTLSGRPRSLGFVALTIGRAMMIVDATIDDAATTRRPDRLTTTRRPATSRLSSRPLASRACSSDMSPNEPNRRSSRP